MNTWSMVLLTLVGLLVVLPASAYLTARMLTWGILTARWRFRQYKIWSEQQESEESSGDEK